MRISRLPAALVLLVALDGCGPVDAPAAASEVISRIELTFTPVGGGAPLVFAFTDPDGDGGASGIADPIVLAVDTEYTLELRFLDELAEPPDDITEEIRAEAEEHFVFVLGDVDGPASSGSPALLVHAYADLESDYGANAVGDDLPVGLIDSVSTMTAGVGTLRIVLRHLPELNGTPQKTADLPELLADGEALPGGVDVDVSFELTIE